MEDLFKVWDPGVLSFVLDISGSQIVLMFFRKEGGV